MCLSLWISGRVKSSRRDVNFPRRLDDIEYDLQRLPRGVDMISVSFFQRCIIYLFHDLPLLFQHSGVCRSRNVVPDFCTGEFGMESVSFTKRYDGIDFRFQRLLGGDLWLHVCLPEIYLSAPRGASREFRISRPVKSLRRDIFPEKARCGRT